MVNENFCTYAGRREDAIISHLYEEVDAETRAAFERHLATCARCRTDLHGLGGVRAELGRWTPREPSTHITGARLVPLPPRGSVGASIRELPTWARVAAAMLVLGAAAWLANIRVSYTSGGVTVRTGWLRVTPEAVTVSAPSSQSVPAPWRADLAVLEQQLRTALASLESAGSKAGPSDVGRSGPGDDATLRQVSTLIQASERRQQRELALRVAELMGDVQAQRQADLLKIERSLGIIQSRTGMEVMRTQRQVNSLAQQVSQRP